MKYATLAGLAATAQAATQLISDAPSDIERSYLEFISQHNKSYATREEYQFRLAQFTMNMKKIQEHNMQNSDMETLAPNHMADWTDEEY